MKHIEKIITIKNQRSLTLKWCFVIFCLIVSSCQKELVFKYDIGETKQVIIANLYPDNLLHVNISKSKQPDDYTSVQYLSNCKVDVYEDNVYKATLPFILKDSLSGFGYYSSNFILEENKTYKIISTHPELGIAEATEYLPKKPVITQYNLLQHATIYQPTMEGKYTFTLQDESTQEDAYFLATFYRILKPVVKKNGDTIYQYDYVYLPSSAAELPNPSNYFRTYFTDKNFNGTTTSFTINFPSQYNDIYKEILLIVELSKCGHAFYEWNTQQIPVSTYYLNEGQLERSNLKGNITNGYGHFTANNSIFWGFTIK